VDLGQPAVLAGFDPGESRNTDNSDSGGGDPKLESAASRQRRRRRRRCLPTFSRRSFLRGRNDPSRKTGSAGQFVQETLPLDLPKGPPKIVIADDNIQNVELLEAYLSDFDCEIRTAYDGEETLRVVAEFVPDLLLLDVMMPRLSGFEVCRKLRARPETKDLLILMVTALNEASDFERGVQSGTDDFLTKPVNKVELLCRIRSLLRVRHLKSQLDRTLAYLAEVESASRAEG
jgi:CheY-like chemotaxis protein